MAQGMNLLDFGIDPDSFVDLDHFPGFFTIGIYRVCQKSDTLLVSEFSTLVRRIICNFCLLAHHFH